MNERRIHQFFTISIILKGAHAVIECLGGILLAFVSTQAIRHFVDAITQNELSEDPSDFIATHLARYAQHLSVSTEHFYAFYLLSHGVVQVFLVIGLLRNRLWAYPVSLAVFGVFIAYQLYRYSYTHGPGLIVLTVFDILVMGLIWHEYRLARRHLASR